MMMTRRTKEQIIKDQNRILAGIAVGYKQIDACAFTGLNVETTFRAIYERTGAENMTHAVAIAMCNGDIPHDIEKLELLAQGRESN
jgi:hypothetical protein